MKSKSAKIFLILAALFSLSSPAFAQEKNRVANYSSGTMGTKTYEHFSFWKSGEITYTYGKNDKDITLNYLGKEKLKNTTAFKVQFPDNRIWYVIPRGKNLKVSDKAGKYTKNFRWEYEGPVNGIGTFCSVCAEDETEAASLIKRYFMK